jgi:hypothetical protein
MKAGYVARLSRALTGSLFGSSLSFGAYLLQTWRLETKQQQADDQDNTAVHIHRSLPQSPPFGLHEIAIHAAPSDD